jgi:ribA/ribD-fused uncharacterized protein
MGTENEIYFYTLKNQFAYMSNFFTTLFKDSDGITYNCSEQYFMYHKCKLFDCENKELLVKILAEKSPSQVKKYGRQVKNYNEKVWGEKRYGIMLQGLRFKFSQNNLIQQKLIATKNKLLYEASKADKIWGIGFYDYDAIKTDKTKFGQNLLGKALMEIRNELQTF